MNGILLYFLTMLCVSLLVDIDAFRVRIRGRRIWRRIKRPVCRAACTYTCTAASEGAGGPVCGLACTKVCKRIKRSLDEILNEFKDNHAIVPLPREFELYDLNKDDVIEVEEFAEILSLESTRDDVMKAFSLADVDDDGKLSEVELDEAPWLFADEDVFAEEVGDDQESQSQIQLE